MWAITTPLALVVMVMWWQHWLLPAERPWFALMLYLLFLSTSVGSAITAVAASCHLAVGRAFSAGMRAGAVHVDGPARPGLRLVE